MQDTKLNLGYLIAAVAGALLFLFLFFSWFSASSGLSAVGAGGSLTAWEAFTIVDIVLAFLAIATVAAALGEIAGPTRQIAWVGPRLIRWFGAIALTLTLSFMWELTSGSFFGKLFDTSAGSWLALLTCVAILVGAQLAERPELADKIRETAASSGLPGTGTSASGPSGGTSSPAASSTAPAASRPTARQPAAPPPPASRPAAPAAPPPPAAPAPSAPAAPAPQAAGPPAGWYPDPQGQARLRYWDGGTWTEQTSA